MRGSNINDIFHVTMLSMDSELSSEEFERLRKIRRAWNFYDGYHWEEIPQDDRPEITINYCRAFVNKFVSFEFGKGFNIKMKPEVETQVVTDSGKTVLQYLDRVWKDNNKEKFCIELGQSKSITGEAWVQVRYFSPNELDDPFGEYPKGRIRVMVIPTSIVFPYYDTHDKEKLVRLEIKYPIEKEETTAITKRNVSRKVVYKQVWTKDFVEIWEGQELIVRVKNKYGVIPFVQIKNFPISGRTDGMSDIEDLIPLNVELNLKSSDVSEIIDYHSAPVTLVFGAKISAIEKGANKVWSFPKDARVENLQLTGDLVASVGYIERIRQSMFEVGGIPEGALGGTQAISNTSGVALQFVNMPLIERTRVKRMMSAEGLQQVNKLILYISLVEGIIKKPEEISNFDFFYNEVLFPDTLPKDELIELQKLETELRLGLETKRGALERLGRENIEYTLSELQKEEEKNLQKEILLREIEADIEAKKKAEEKRLNSGMLNGETNLEILRKEINGANMPTSI